MWDTNIDRRAFLKAAAFGAAASPRMLSAAAASVMSAEVRTLSFSNLHTGEKLAATYWEKGAYIPESLENINRVLRDHRNNEVHEISQRLLDTLFRLAGEFRNGKPFEVISGYRSPGTNAMLRQQGHGVAEHSLHMDGLAIDIRVQGIQLAKLRSAAIALEAGGVGYYPKEQFVHVDVGRRRTW